MACFVPAAVTCRGRTRCLHPARAVGVAIFLVVLVAHAAWAADTPAGLLGNDGFATPGAAAGSPEDPETAMAAVDSDGEDSPVVARRAWPAKPRLSRADADRGLDISSEDVSASGSDLSSAGSSDRADSESSDDGMSSDTLSGSMSVLGPGSSRQGSSGPGSVGDGSPGSIGEENSPASRWVEALYPESLYTELGCDSYDHCMSNILPTIDRVALHLHQRNEGLSLAQAGERLCADCFRAMCCRNSPGVDLDHINSVCNTDHCYLVPEDIDTGLISSEITKEQSNEDSRWTLDISPHSFLYQYLEVMADGNFPMYQNDQFSMFRRLSREILVGSNLDLAETIESLPGDRLVPVMVGIGSWVFKATLPDGTVYAVKRPNMMDPENLPETLLAEIGTNEMLKWSDNTHLTKYHGFYYTWSPEKLQYVTLVYEWCPSTLDQLVKTHGEELKSRPDIVADIVAQAVLGLRVLALNRISHRDLKVDNFFLSGLIPAAGEPLGQPGDIVVKVGDFDRALRYAPLPDTTATTPVDIFRKCLDEGRGGDPARTPVELQWEAMILSTAVYPDDLTSVQYMPPEGIFHFINHAAGSGNGPAAAVREKMFRVEGEGAYRDAVRPEQMAAVVPGCDKAAGKAPLAGVVQAKDVVMPSGYMAAFDPFMLGVLALDLLLGRAGAMVENYVGTYLAFDATGLPVNDEPRICGGLENPTDTAAWAYCYLSAALYELDQTPSMRNPGGHLQRLLAGVEGAGTGMVYAIGRMLDLSPQRRATILDLSVLPWVGPAMAAAGAREAAAASQAAAAVALPFPEWQACHLLTLGDYAQPMLVPTAVRSARQPAPNPNSEPSSNPRVGPLTFQPRTTTNSLVQLSQVVIQSASWFPNVDRVKQLYTHFSSVPYVHRKSSVTLGRPGLNGYLVVMVWVRVSFSNKENPLESGLHLEAYTDDRRVAYQPESFWTRVCKNKQTSDRWGRFKFTRKTHVAVERCKDNEANGEYWTVTPMIVEADAPWGQPWTLAVTTRIKGQDVEECHRIRISSPLEVNLLRWPSHPVTDRSAQSLVCAVCLGTFTRLRSRTSPWEDVDACQHRRLVHAYPWADSDHYSLRECQAYQRDLANLLGSLAPFEVEGLARAAPRHTCGMLTQGMCASG